MRGRSGFFDGGADIGRLIGLANRAPSSESVRRQSCGSRTVDLVTIEPRGAKSPVDMRIRSRESRAAAPTTWFLGSRFLKFGAPGEIRTPDPWFVEAAAGLRARQIEHVGS